MYGKLLIQCEMKVLTGMHIGGNTTFSPIGAVDKPVIKDPRTNAPIVPCPAPVQRCLCDQSGSVP